MLFQGCSVIIKMLFFLFIIETVINNYSDGFSNQKNVHCEKDKFSAVGK